MPREEAEKLFRAGREAYWQENYERALVLLEQCLELEPGHVEALWSRGETLLALRRPEESLSVLGELIAEHPEDPSVGLAVMEVLRTMGEWEKLRPLAELTLENDPDNPFALNYLGWAVLGQATDVGIASNLFYRAIEAEERFYSAWLGLGWSTLFARELAEAIGAFTSARELAVPEILPNPEKSKFEALWGLGLAYLHSGRAREALQIGNEMNVRNFEPLKTGTIRAMALIRQGVAEGGLAEGEFAISQGSENPYLLLDMAFEYAKMGDTTNAARLLGLTSTDAPPRTIDDYEIGCRRVTVLALMGRPDEAIAETESLLSAFGDDENLLNMQGVLYIQRGRQGDHLRARSYFDKALKHSRDDITLGNRASFFAGAGDFGQALVMAREALKVAKTKPRSPVSVWVLPLKIAMYTAWGGDEAGAKKLIRAFLEDPAVPDWAARDAREVLGNIESGDVRQGPGDLPPVSGHSHAAVKARHRRLTVDRYELKVCEECEKTLGWLSCEPAYDVPGLKEIGDIDAYGFAKESDETEAVCVGECKLRFEDDVAPVSYSEMNQLVKKKMRPLRNSMDDNNDNRRLRGFFFANADYDADARQLAREAGVRMFRVNMSSKWRERDDWRLRLEELDGDQEAGV